MASDDLATLVDREAIRAAIVRERAARDARDWSLMAESYAADCQIVVSWFRGTGPEFVEASRRRTAQTRSFHYVWPATVDLRGDRALAESPLEIRIRFSLGAQPIEVVSHGRMINRMVRVGGTWKMASLDVIYRSDEARSIDPDRALPARWAEIEQYRASYRMMSWMIAATGLAVDEQLYGEDRPEAVGDFLKSERRWLTSQTV